MKSDEATRSVRALGFSDHESHTYIALLKLGPSHASAVAAEVGLLRTTIYPILKSLAEKGSVNVSIRRNRKIFSAQRPDLLAKSFARKLSSFESLIPELPKPDKMAVSEYGIRYLDGPKEIVAFYESLLDEYSAKRKRDRSYRVISAQRTWEDIDADFFLDFRYERGKRGIHTRLLLTSESRNTNPTDPRLLRHVRFLPEGYIFQDSIDIHADKVLVMSHEHKIAVVITVPTLVGAFQSVFDILWSMTPPESC